MDTGSTMDETEEAAPPEAIEINGEWYSTKTLKAILFELAKEGEPRPDPQTILGQALMAFTGEAPEDEDEDENCSQ